MDISRPYVWPLLLTVLALAVLAGLWLAAPADVGAHATLVKSEPPADGLVLGSPGSVRLRFSEEVRAANPAPSIAVRDADGQPVSMSDSPVGPFDDPRVLVANVPTLDPGTYTVTWTVTSAVDGHALSGTFAFRVGGGVPPGIATTEDAAPAPWAVATRWTSFLGAAIAAGMFLFQPLVLRRGEGPESWRWRRALVILGASLLALAATLAEPVLLASTTDAGTLGGALRGLPGGWWWRPAMLVPLVALAGLGVLWRRGPDRVQAAMSWAGAGLALASLLGLVFTSHAAGRETWRWPAIASNVLHQWSTALWIGGLVALVVWLGARRGAADREPGPAIDLRRFSTLALVLFSVATLTGLVNAGFVLPVIASLREEGFSREALSPLWTSRYGIVLLLKAGALLIPFALATMHRAAVRRMARSVTGSLATVPGRIRATLRWEALAVAAVVLGGSTIALSAPPVPEQPVLDRITLVAPARPTDDGELAGELAPETMLVHLAVDPARQGANQISVRLTDAMGQPVPNDPKPNVSLDFLSLDHGPARSGVDLGQDPADPAIFTTSGLDLSMNGWWQITASIERIGAERMGASFYVVLPDPNTSGFDAPPAPDTGDDAQAVFQRGLAAMTSWRSVRWTEYLGSGEDVLVVGQFAVTDGAGTGPRAYEQVAVYSAAFAPRPDGSVPDPPEMDARRSISIGDRGWLRTTGGDWLEEGPRRFEVPSEWESIYRDGTNIRLGTSQVINGEDAQIVTFHSPDRPDQSEAWFAWWVGKESGNVLQVTMIARQHYMVWQYVDIDADLGIRPPTG